MPLTSDLGNASPATVVLHSQKTWFSAKCKILGDNSLSCRTQALCRESICGTTGVDVWAGNSRFAAANALQPRKSNLPQLEQRFGSPHSQEQVVQQRVRSFLLGRHLRYYFEMLLPKYCTKRAGTPCACAELLSPNPLAGLG